MKWGCGMDEQKVKRLIDLVILRDELDRAFDNMSTQQMCSCMEHYHEVEREMVSIAIDLDKK